MGKEIGAVRWHHFLSGRRRRKEMLMGWMQERGKRWMKEHDKGYGCKSRAVK